MEVAARKAGDRSLGGPRSPELGALAPNGCILLRVPARMKTNSGARSVSSTGPDQLLSGHVGGPGGAQDIAAPDDREAV
jgi:hypothetical protein